MEQPTNSTGLQQARGHVCQLMKSIYGLRQAREIWGSVINVRFIKWGFQQSTQDQRLYFYRKGNKFINLIVVVDDMTFGSNDRSLINWFKEMLVESFKVKLLGELKLLIGWEFDRTENGLYIGQQKYIRRILDHHNLNHTNYAHTLLPTATDLTSTHDGDIKLSTNDHKRYRSLIGGLSYLAICTRPDISFAVSVLSRQLHAPSERHLILAKRVVRYVAGTVDMRIFYP